MTDWRWIRLDIVWAIHDRLLAEHGGADGLRDRGLVESAVARPRTLASYGTPDAAAVAAAYAVSLARNHGFIDGNKRTGWVAARLFLRLNGYDLDFDQADAVRLMNAVAAGETSEVEVGDWFRLRVRKTSSRQA